MKDMYYRWSALKRVFLEAENAEKVVIKGYEKEDLFIFKADIGWRVCCGITGGAITAGHNSKKTAIEACVLLFEITKLEERKKASRDEGTSLAEEMRKLLAETREEFQRKELRGSVNPRYALNEQVKETKWDE